MSRRTAREMALQALFQLDYNEINKEKALESVIFENSNASQKANEYARLLVDGTQAHLKEIDQIISDVSTEWKLDRMAGVDRNIVRIAVFEMRFGPEQLSPNIVINEAVELAKVFGTEDSSRFINGVLASLIKEREK